MGHGKQDKMRLDKFKHSYNRNDMIDRYEILLRLIS